jgi:hypothetical protein
MKTSDVLLALGAFGVGQVLAARAATGTVET